MPPRKRTKAKGHALIPDPAPGQALWLQFPGPAGIAEWLVAPCTATRLLELGEVTVNGLHATVLPPGPYAIRPNVIRLHFHKGVEAAQSFDPHTTDQLRFATHGKA